MQLGEEMKLLENNSEPLSSNWVIIRLDMKNGSKFTKKMEKPFDHRFTNAMIETTEAMHNEFKPIMSYCQSDEISFAFLKMEYFNLRIQKIVSVFSSATTGYFNDYMRTQIPEIESARFDCRVFNVPDKEYCIKYFKWRNCECQTNAITAIVSKFYPQENIQNKNIYKRLQLIRNDEHLFKIENKFGTFFKSVNEKKLGFNPKTKEYVTTYRKITYHKSFAMNEDMNDALF